MNRAASSRYVLASLVLGGFVAVAPVAAAPGDSFGGDLSGCVPADKQALSCSQKYGLALTKLRKAVLKCHLKQASLAFKAGEGQEGFSNAEEVCETENPSTSARAKFEALIAKLGVACPAEVHAAAVARGVTILGDRNTAGSMDAMNDVFFCDATSGQPIDPGGDDGGWIPATDENNTCSVKLAKSWVKLDAYLAKCHAYDARYGFVDRPFDDDTCEFDTLRGVVTKYNKYVQRLLDNGLCPPCLADSLSPTYVITVGGDLETARDAENAEIYPCPAP